MNESYLETVRKRFDRARNEHSPRALRRARRAVRAELVHRRVALPADGLLELYGLVALASGPSVTPESVHDANVVWAGRPLVPYGELSAQQMATSWPYVAAIGAAARSLDVPPAVEVARLAVPLLVAALVALALLLLR